VDEPVHNRLDRGITAVELWTTKKILKEVLISPCAALLGPVEISHRSAEYLVEGDFDKPNRPGQPDGSGRYSGG
jgi:hypothetical protein